ncbi:hypothetical protein [Limisalsivibrio acetivorans]|uniref:hypothetical protein n=1 Tax=Limisalsivibrio acetivorans TaxID=1304888 RepID=UPI0003B6C019|nr:hypothetical protein [Limisalsivibrio acetivorans]
MLRALYTIFIIAAMFSVIACSQGVVEDEDAEKAPQVQDQAQNKDPKDANPHGDMGAGMADGENPHAGMNMPKEKTIKIPKEVSDKYKSLILGVKNETEGIDVQTEVLIGQKAEVKGTPYAIEVEHYIPDFVIDTDGAFTTRSAEENNPVAKIKIYEEGQLFFDGWLYKNFPNAHGSFTHPDYELTIIKSVTK